MNCSTGHIVLSETFSSVGHVLPEKTTPNMERQQVTDNVVSALCKSCPEVEIIYIPTAVHAKTNNHNVMWSRGP